MPFTLRSPAVVVRCRLDGISSYVDSYFTTSIARESPTTSDDCIRSSAALSLSYYDTHDTGNLKAQVTEDIERSQKLRFFIVCSTSLLMSSL